jgi:hypothetical protein
LAEPTGENHPESLRRAEFPVPNLKPTALPARHITLFRFVYYNWRSLFATPWQPLPYLAYAKQIRLKHRDRFRMLKTFYLNTFWNFPKSLQE